MTVSALIKRLQDLVTDSPSLKDAEVEFEYRAYGGDDDTYGWDENRSVDNVYDLETRVVLSSL
jgi:hypothetical protein